MSGWRTNSDFDSVLGNLPPGWHVARLGATCWVRARLGWRGLTAEEYVVEGVAFLSTPDIKSTTIDYSLVNRISEQRYQESPEIMLSDGDVLLTKDGSTIGIVHVVQKLDEPTTVNGSIAVITPDDGWDSRFLGYALKSNLGQSLMRLLQDGMGVPHLFQRDIKKMDFPRPAREHQEVIADFLDREAAQIDAMIEANESLVTALEGRRSAALSAIVLPQQGKKIARDWYGSVPWDAPKLWRHAKITNGSTPKRERAHYWDGDIPWLNSSVANLDSVREADQFVTEEAIAECHLPVLPVGSVLVGLTGQGKTRGKATELRLRATINQHIAAIIPDPSHWDSRYLTLSLRAAYEELRRLSDSNGATKGALTCQALAAFRVPLPPLDEQRSLARRADAATTITTDLIEASKNVGALLRERREALITAAVTGKIDPVTGIERLDLTTEEVAP